MTETTAHAAAVRPAGARRRVPAWARRAMVLMVAVVLGLGIAAPAGADEQDERFSFGQSKWSRPLLGVVVGVDPGHNGGNATAPEVRQRVSDGRGGFKSCNTVGTATPSGYPEHAFTFDVAQELTERLEDLGATVVATRTDDNGVGPCVDVRGRFAEDNDVDIFLSLHANGSANVEEYGFFVIVADPPLSASQAQPSFDLAEAIVQGLHEGGFDSNPAIEDAITTRDDLATLNFARRPAVLIELGEMRNPDEAAVMESAEGRAEYAEALVLGVLAWHENRD